MLKNLKVKKYPWQIYAFWLANFVVGFEFSESILIPFFKEWGGLNQTQIQILQSWFMFWVFIFEVPTGIVGDLKGTKFSVILGTILIGIGRIVYILYPHLFLFLLAEFTIALGMAFISGSNSAWLYDTSKKLNLKEKYRSISVVFRNLWLAGMLLGSLSTGFVLHYMQLRWIFGFTAITIFLNAIILSFIPAVSHKQDGESFSPNYKELLSKSIKVLKHNKRLSRYVVFVLGLSSTAYFVIWLYQTVLDELSVDLNQFGIYKAYLLIVEIAIASVFSKIIDSKKFSPRTIGLILAILVGTGFISVFLFHNIFSVFILLGLSGGIGLQVRTLYSKEINDEIESNQRATVLSFVSMSKKVVLTVANPLVGLAVDTIGVFITLGILGFLSLFTGFVLPKNHKNEGKVL